MSMTHVPEILYDKARYTLATKSTVDFVADLSPVCRKSTVDGSFDFADRVAVDIVANVEHVQLGRLCRKWVIFVARMSNVLSTLSPMCTGQSDTVVFVDFVAMCTGLKPAPK